MGECIADHRSARPSAGAGARLSGAGASADGLKTVAVRGRVRVLAVTAQALVARHPLLGEDRRGQGDLAGKHGGGADLGELGRLALAVAAEQLQAFALRGRPVPPP